MASQESIVQMNLKKIIALGGAVLTIAIGAVFLP